MFLVSKVHIYVIIYFFTFLVYCLFCLIIITGDYMSLWSDDVIIKFIWLQFIYIRDKTQSTWSLLTPMLVDMRLQDISFPKFLDGSLPNQLQSVDLSLPFSQKVSNWHWIFHFSLTTTIEPFKIKTIENSNCYYQWYLVFELYY